MRQVEAAWLGRSKVLHYTVSIIYERLIKINSKVMASTSSLESFLKIRIDRWVINVKREGKVLKFVVDR